MGRTHPYEGERDACGIGFVADAHGRTTRAIVDAALEALCRVKHRGAVAADDLTGDGAGLLLPLPRALLAAEIEGGPEENDRLGVAMIFADPSGTDPARRIVAEACAQEALQVVAWRVVPTEDGALGDAARATRPAIEQAIVLRPLGTDADEGERRAFRARRRIQTAAREQNVRLYIASFSFRTITYKGLVAADQLARFYEDLTDSRYETWFALFHQRFATNTTPTWERAQPFRFLAHNGEINTIRGNVAAMSARQGRLGSADLAPEDLLRPVVDVEGSDSAILDEALELLQRGGRDVQHAAAMLVPGAWEDVARSDGDVRDFFRYHSCLIEPWDGPAGLVFTDGERVAATLDRNGLRPLRVSVCDDGLVACSSESGAVPTRGHGRVRRLKIGPGQGFCVDPSQGGVIEDSDIKKGLARRRPYGEWLREHVVEGSPGTPVEAAGEDLTARQVAAGFNKEEFTVVIRPMATEGTEPTSSMGDDTAQPPLAQWARPVFGFLKQRFAQVTNPPIDHLRERHVMSLTTRLGARHALLQEKPEAAKLREYASFLLWPSAVDDLANERERAGRVGGKSRGAALIDATFDVAEGPDGLEAALHRMTAEAAGSVLRGAEYVVVSDRKAGPERVAVPSALAAGAVHHELVGRGLRARASLIVDCDDPRETHHLAVLLTNGADAVCPRLTLQSIAELAKRGRLGGGVSSDEAQRNYFHAIEDGLLKVMSKMGISTIDSYRGAQIVEAIGLGPDVMELCFDGIASVLGGLSLIELGADVWRRHELAYGGASLPSPGLIKHRKGGDYHATNPEVVDSLHDTVGLSDDPDDRRNADLTAAHALQRATRGEDAAYAKFASLVNERPPAEPRDLLEFVAADDPTPLAEVEPATSIATRFSTGAMSHGALSAEAHETLSVALNMIGGMANTGEGGEAPERYRDQRNSGIKQIASGRFGVTPAYVAFAKELQIKMAQGSKPGEGGQLPGVKVSAEIARLRHTVPGVALISPPPHHDIYSIEDLAQLVFDLKQANPEADVSVKLVASEGVGTIAAGVVKALSDVVHISGADGGTGASPLSSIKNAGLPWEIGLAETQRALVENDLRGRARLRVDGGFKTGRDVVVAALLGADEFSFGTAALLAEGCILVRTCHRDTCPVGIATQNPELRKKFAGTPAMVARYLLLVAEEARLLLSSLGLRSIDEAVGRVDLLRQRRTNDARHDSLDLTPLLVEAGRRERRFTGRLAMQRPRSSLGDRLFADAVETLESGDTTELSYDITTADRTVGARLGCWLGSRPPDATRGTVRADFEGEAGQSFGAFLADGIELNLVGEANDYVAKSMSGGRITVRPPANDAGDPYLVGNTVLYGATGGQLFVAGRAGERFAVRNSGAVAVIEGAGDHACEYMTAGAVVILGPVGRNLGAGMSGGEAYVYDPSDELDASLNTQLVGAYEPTGAQLESLKRVIARHREATGSSVAAEILASWEESHSHFRRVAPVAEIARLEAMFEGTAAAYV
ncbi:MAG: glutamate synthase large subunit [Actinobacteria bacterium]|nr:glutamate synthase large subunit [Actinomycetota bacterium]